MLLLLPIITLTHPFTTVFIVASVFGIFLLGWKIPSPWRLPEEVHSKLASISLLLFAIMLFVSWHIFFANEVLKTAIEFIPSIFKVGFRWASQEDIIYGPPSGPLGTFLQYYRLGIYGVLAITGAMTLIYFRKRNEIRLSLALIVGVGVGSLVLLVSPAADYALGRITLYGGFLAAVLSSYFLTGIDNRKSKLRKVVVASFRIFPLLVSVTFLVSYTYTSAYVSFVHAEDVSVSSFAVQRADRRNFVPVTEAMVAFY